MLIVIFQQVENGERKWWVYHRSEGGKWGG